MKVVRRSASTLRRGLSSHRRRIGAAIAATLVVAATANSSASATSNDAPQLNQHDSDSSDHQSATSPWICDEGDEPRIVAPDTTAPSLPFRGIVYAGFMPEPDSDTLALVVRYHNTASRTNTEIIVEGLHWNHPLSIDRTSEGLLIGNWALSVADSCTPRQADEGHGIDPWVARHVDVLIPWGRPARLEAQFERTRQSEADTDAAPAIDSVSDGLQSEYFRLGTHANGVHVVAGDQVGAYVLAQYADLARSTNPALYGDSRSWNLNDWVFLLGTDGDLLAFAIHGLEPAWAPQEITVMSMRTGEVVACGLGAFGTFLLFSPANEGLVVPEIKLPPSGVLDVSVWGEQGADCPRGIDESFFEYLAIQPVPLPAPPLAERLPRPVELPIARAPQWPFGGVVRAFERYDPQRFVHHRVLQYYDSSSGDVSEIVFDGETGPRVGRLRLTDGGVALGVSAGFSVLVPWGSAPEFVRNEALGPRSHPSRQRSLTLANDMSAAEPEAGLPCVADWLDEGGVAAKATLYDADYGSRWGGRLKLLDLEVGDARAEYVLHTPWADRALAVSVTTTCAAPVYAAGYVEHVPRLLGSDGVVLMVSYTYLEGDEFYGGPGTDLTLMFSLKTGEILTCGIEPVWSSTLFIESGAVLPSPRLPPSGWIDPYPCSREGSDVVLEDCISIVLGADDRPCARELDFRSIGTHGPDLAPIPAAITASRSESTP